jgi:hypothetical protein
VSGKPKHRVLAEGEWFNTVLLFPDIDASPCLWLLDDDGDCLWGDAPLSASLTTRLDQWLETWTVHCYGRKCVWDSREVYDAWSEQAVLLCALANRELVPLGFTVIWRPSHFPDEHGRRESPLPPNQDHRRGLRDLTGRQREQIVAESNVVLRQHQEVTITERSTQATDAADPPR